MANRTKSIALTLLIAVTMVATLTPGPAVACGPFLEYATFSFENNPDFPLRRFARGQLGVVRPLWARAYLFVAYRYLSMKPLSAAEQAGVVKLWDSRIIIDWTVSNPAIDRWLAARKLVGGVGKAPNIQTSRNISDNDDDAWQFFDNCLDDSFISAANTLNARVAKFGANSATARDWVEAQDSVFCHCSDPPYTKWPKRDPEGPFPKPAPDSADPLIKADRAYQIAAAHFYAKNYDLALSEFTAIAADRSSPWKDLAPYLVARTLIRKGTVSKEINLAFLRQAEVKLKEVLASGSLSSLHESARQLLNFIVLRLDPPTRLSELTAVLSVGKEPAAIEQNLADYTIMLDNVLKQESDDSPVETKFADLPASVQKDDMTDWICTYQSGGPGALEHALARWKETGSNAWLLACLVKVKAGDAQVQKLLEEASRLSAGSPAYLTAAYHSVRLLREGGKPEAARQRLAATLKAAGSTMPPSARNLFYYQAVELATSLDEFLKYACPAPSVVSSGIGGMDGPDDIAKVEKSDTFGKEKPGFEMKTAVVINTQMPLKIMARLAAAPTLPANLRADVSQAVWVRGAMLRDEAATTVAAPVLKTAVPALAPLLNAYAGASTSEEKQFAAAFAILKFPGMRPSVTSGVGRTTPIGKIDDYQDNWWCAGGGAAQAGEKPLWAHSDFLTASDSALAKAECAKIKALGPGPNYLAAIVINWARSHPRDPRVPEALYRVVRATKLGCTDGKSSDFSKQAFQVLHKGYPGNNWTRQTPYYY